MQCCKSRTHVQTSKRQEGQEAQEGMLLALLTLPVELCATFAYYCRKSETKILWGRFYLCSIQYRDPKG